MDEIVVQHGPGQRQLSNLGVSCWPIWNKGVSEFAWTYAERVTCYFLEGEATVIPVGGEPVTVGKGDLVTFPSGLACTWQVTRPVRKRYRFGSTVTAAGPAPQG